MTETRESEISYFGLEAYLGTTKHGGSLSSTRELIELCRIGADSYVLDVGCGVGATRCYLVKKIGCRVIGVDIRADMIARAAERARRENVTDGVDFMIADAQNLPFSEGTFDAVISESVTLFVDNRQEAIRGYVGVTKPGGYVGLNEEVWVKYPVPPRVSLYLYMKKGVELSGEVPTTEVWQTYLEEAGLNDLVVRTYSQMSMREFSRLWRYSLPDLGRGLYRMLVLIIRNPAARRWMRSRARAPWNLMKYLGYGVYVGRR